MTERGEPSNVAGLLSRRTYNPDVTSLACGRFAAARETAGLSAESFALALARLLAWQPAPSVISAWESTVAPPGDVLVAAEVIAAPARRVSGRATSDDLACPAPEHDGSPASTVAADVAAMQAFRSADLKLGGGNLYERVAGYLRRQVAPRLVMAESSADDRVIFTSAAALGEMAGWMAHDAGRDWIAEKHFVRALDLVTMSGDRQLKAHVLASIGHLAHHVNNPEAALKAGHDGIETLAAGPRNPELEARLLAIQARGYAAQGQSAESIRSLSLAEKALVLSADEPRSDWVSAFDEASLASEAARCMQQLGQVGEAQRQADRIVALRPPERPRSRAFGLFIHAQALLAQRKPDEAAGLASEILDVTGSIASHVVVQQFVVLRQRLVPYRTNPVVKDFMLRLNPVLRQRLWTDGNFQANIQPVFRGGG